ncbi:MAG: GatB/YqeY domain-containing protein [Candidatus Competibacteraceae bacterium]|nr:GatB/YqeY domain-containing protein [Candidatus Competibacteraceae bacterium]
MSVKARIQDDMKSAMRAKQRERLGTIRLIMAAIKQREVDERVELDDTQTVAVLDKMLKQRRESAAQYRQAGRDDLAAKEEAEIGVIEDYMPQPLSDEEIDLLISEAIAATHAQSVKDMGQVMAYIKPKAQGRVDMAAISARVKTRLAL